jgi:hypothetical protein
MDELVDEELMAFVLFLLGAFDALVFGGVEEVEGGDGVGEDPDQDGNG